MNRSDRVLCSVYALVALAALIATWTFNLQFLAEPGSGGIVGFVRAAYANAASTSIANDLLFLCVSAFVFMALEARRLRIRFVWLYIALSALIAVSVFFPLFLIARQRKLAERARRAAAGFA